MLAEGHVEKSEAQSNPAQPLCEFDSARAQPLANSA